MIIDKQRDRIRKAPILMAFIIFCMLINGGVVSASLGTFKSGECVDIKTILNTTAVTISSLNYPNSSKVLGITSMEKNGLTFNYTFCNTSTSGTYNYDYNDTEGNVYVNSFEVTLSGQILSGSQGWVLIGSLVIMIILSLVFLFIANGSENTTSKIVFYCLSGIIFIMSILYTVVMMQQTLSEFTNILTGIETFWFVVKMLVGIGVFVLLIIVILILIKAWKIKRGYRDE